MSELRTNRIIPRDGLPSGSSGGIIQVKSVTKTDPFDTLSTSYTDVTGLAVSITPTRADSKILVTYHTNASMEDDGYRGGLRLMRDSTAISVADADGDRIVSTVAMADDPVDDEINCYSATFLDSPSTTSSTTYKVQLTTESSGNTGNVFVNRSGEDADNVQNARTVSSITVMEVSG